MNRNDGYDDLLNSISADSNKGSTAEPKANNAGGFKVEIKDLDSQFNTGEKPKREQPKPQTIKRREPVQRKRPVGNYKEEYAKAQQKPVKEKEITMLPDFENDKRYQPKPNQSTQNINRAPVRRPANAPQRRNPNQAKTGNAPMNAQNQNANSPKIIKKNSNGKAKAKKKFDLKAFLKKSKTAILIVTICVALAALISSYAISCMNDILAINRDDENIVTVNIPNSIDTKDAIDILKDNGLIKHKYFCMFFAKVVQYRDDNYLTGIYYLTPSMGLENMLSSFKETPISGETVTLAFPEGYTVNQIAEKLEKYEVCSAGAFYATLRDVDFSNEYSFVSSIENKQERYQLLEGYLYPDTYEFYIGENASNVVRKFLDNFNNKWTEEYSKQAKKLNMSVDEVVVLASLIEKEAYGNDQMPLVSSVFHNRLNKRGVYPTLQSNATSDYVNEYISKNVTDSAALTRYMNKYSTYKCEGLPVGAICNPGDAAIHAALYPKDTNYYYFLHDNNKKIYLAATDSEHRANGIEALKANREKSE